jgi:GNAT superfamily N-acetyltransferase
LDELILETTIKNEKERIVNAYINGENVGHLAYSLGFEDTETEVSIDTMGVNEIHQLRGIGTLMLKYVIKNYSGFAINSGFSNEEARIVQEKIGFAVTSPNRLKLEVLKEREINNIKNVNPQPEMHRIPPIIIEIRSFEDLENMYQMCKGNIELLCLRLHKILSHVSENDTAYNISYSELYNMMSEFLQQKAAESEHAQEVARRFF